jgi:predicted Ser/Thr protein kinase
MPGRPKPDLLCWSGLDIFEVEFSETALKAKMVALDLVSREPDIMTSVLNDHFKAPYELTGIPRTWEPAGGSSLYQVISENVRFMLKIKHVSVHVESKLEGESDFLNLPALRNEYELMGGISEKFRPRIYFYCEQQKFCFLMTEWLTDFSTVTENMHPTEILESYQTLVEIVRKLYDDSIVHTDIHENNICFRGKQPVLVDFEEARVLKQKVPFVQSLDYCGSNHWGNVGLFPENHSPIRGYTCLLRLREVFKSHLKTKIPDLLTECKFNNECPFNLDSEQEPDDRVYQSIELDDLRIEGHRSPGDTRIDLTRFLVDRLGRHQGPVSFVDIGSNLGVFCNRIAELKRVDTCLGIEAHGPYVTAARALAFLNDNQKTEYRTFVCGRDKLSSFTDKIDFAAMLSVYHHVSEKGLFLEDLASCHPDSLLAEFAVQDRYYSIRGNLESEIEHIRKTLGFKYAHNLGDSTDYHRPLILFRNTPLGLFERTVIRLMRKKQHGLVKKLVSLYIRMSGDRPDEKRESLS